jgi:cytidylate kinase
MNQDPKNNDKNYVIAIGRQFGCGGREVGQRVAQLLGIDYYDKQLLLEASKASGIHTEMFEAADERTPKFFPSLWPLNLAMAGATFMGDVTMSDDSIYKAQCQVMKDLVDRKSCVIVGRTADYVLRDYCPVVSVFLHAPIEDRVARIIGRGDCDTQEAAEKRSDKINKLRAEYYNFYTDKLWGHADSYDLCLDSSLLGIEGTAQFIVDFVHRRLSI